MDIINRKSHARKDWVRRVYYNITNTVHHVTQTTVKTPNFPTASYENNLTRNTLGQAEETKLTHTQRLRGYFLSSQ